MTSRHPRDVRSAEVRGFQHDIRAVIIDLGGEPAHHAGQPDSTPVVGDHDIRLIEGAFDVVQRLQGLPRLRMPDLDGAPQLVGIEGV